MHIQEITTGLRSSTEPAKSLSKTVLVVEDQFAARLALCEYLSAVGWQVLSACTGQEALQVCRGRCDVAVLLTDYSMPGMRGDELARTVRTMNPDVAVAYMTGFPELELDPPGPVLQKPLDLDEIVMELEKCWLELSAAD
jgi:CheY-like chemotaxis protein